MFYISNNFATDHFFFNTYLYIRIFVSSIKVYLDFSVAGPFMVLCVQNKQELLFAFKILFNCTYKYDYRQNKSLSLVIFCFQIQYRQKKGRQLVFRWFSGILVFKLSLKCKQQEIILTLEKNNSNQQQYYTSHSQYNILAILP